MFFPSANYNPNRNCKRLSLNDLKNDLIVQKVHSISETLLFQDIIKEMIARRENAKKHPVTFKNMQKKIKHRHTISYKIVWWSLLYVHSTKETTPTFLAYIVFHEFDSNKL